MIETRHEKISIALAGYVIGFTTAFIAFGVTNMHHEDNMHEWKIKYNAPVQKTLSYKKVQENINEILLDDSGLYVNVGGYKRVLSAKVSSLATSVVQSTATPGFFTAIHKQQVSPDGWFAFYCEQLTSNSKTCDPYVYSLFNDTIYKANIGATQIKDLNVSWLTNNKLTINGVTSITESQPWKFPTKDSTTTVEAKNTNNEHIVTLKEEVKTSVTAPDIQVQ